MQREEYIQLSSDQGWCNTAIRGMPYEFGLEVCEQYATAWDATLLGSMVSVQNTNQSSGTAQDHAPVRTNRFLPRLACPCKALMGTPRALCRKPECAAGAACIHTCNCSLTERALLVKTWIVLTSAASSQHIVLALNTESVQADR